jgi:hypothetical protein
VAALISPRCHLRSGSTGEDVGDAAHAIERRLRIPSSYQDFHGKIGKRCHVLDGSRSLPSPHIFARPNCFANPMAFSAHRKANESVWLFCKFVRCLVLPEHSVTENEEELGDQMNRNDRSARFPESKGLP